MVITPLTPAGWVTEKSVGGWPFEPAGTVTVKVAAPVVGLGVPTGVGSLMTGGAVWVGTTEMMVTEPGASPLLASKPVT